MRQYEETEEVKKVLFAKQAAAYFTKHPAAVTYASNGPVIGEPMALRWGMGGDCVVVVMLDEYAEIVNYVQFIDKDKGAEHNKFNEAGLRAIS